MIGKTKSGVSMKDVTDSYGGVLEDVQGMVQSGDIIACKNRKAKDTILYPRGNSFLTKLSGTATTAPEQEYLVTSEDLTNEIRRGDAVLVGESWCVPLLSSHHWLFFFPLAHLVYSFLFYHVIGGPTFSVYLYTFHYHCCNTFW